MAIESKEIYLRAKDVNLIYPSGRKAMPGFGLGWRKLLGADFPVSEIKSRYTLKGINLSLTKGDRIALTGPNGAGKTSLLKLLAGGLPPTSGKVEHNGRLLSMLNPSVGINHEATGYENILLKGLYLNQSLAFMREIAGKIIEFSELEDYIHQPVRTYSAGMRARLSFSIVVFSEPEILLLDEWMGAGDRNFQVKAANKMNEFVEKAGITVLATHNERLRKMICNRELSLKAGEVVDIS